MHLKDKFEVIDSVPDVIGPELESYDVSEYVFDVSNGDKTFEFNASFSDETSGFEDSYFYMQWHSPSGEQNINSYLGIEEGIYITDNKGQVRNDITNIYFDNVEVIIPQYSEPGLWTLDFVHSQDDAGNDTYLYTEDLVDLGFTMNLK